MKSIFSIFKRGLEKTTTKVARTIGSIFTGVKAHSAESFDELEELLIAADFGVPASLRIVGEIRDRYERGAIATNADLARIASETVKDILRQRARAIHTGEPGKPTVILMVGVNGSGKTTTIGKLAARFRRQARGPCGLRHVPRRGGRAAPALGGADRFAGRFRQARRRPGQRRL